MTQVNIFNVWNLRYIFCWYNYFIGSIDIKNDITTIQSSSRSMSADAFQNITKKRKMNESDELNEKRQEISSKVYILTLTYCMILNNTYVLF